MQFLLSQTFLQELKVLEKKFPGIRYDLKESLQSFSPDTSTSLGKGIFKVRISSRDMRKGKSGGFRAYLYLKRTRDIVVALSLFSKSQKESLTENETISLLRSAQAEFLHILF